MTANNALPRWGRLSNSAQETDQRRQALKDPGAYHGDLAASELHWHDAGRGCWLSRDPETGEWSGFDAKTGKPVTAARDPQWRPWSAAFDEGDAPFYRWFTGASTNAGFNEVDRHVLRGRGAHPAFVFEGDRWDPSKNDGQGGPVFELRIEYRRLLLETVLRAEVLSGLGLGKGDRIAFNLPNIPEQLYYTEAAKRLGIIYTPVFGGFSAKTLSDRIADAGARVVVTADGGYRNAEVVSYKESYTDQALDNFIPLPAALAALDEVLARFDIGAVARRLSQAAKDALTGEITVERSDVMRELGRALSREDELDAERSAEIRTTVARQLAEVQHIVEQVVVAKYTGQDIVVQPRDRWSPGPCDCGHRTGSGAGAVGRLRRDQRRRAARAGRPQPVAGAQRQSSGPAPGLGLSPVHHLYLGLHRQAEGRRAHPRRLAGRHFAHHAHGLRCRRG